MKPVRERIIDEIARRLSALTRSELLLEEGSNALTEAEQLLLLEPVAEEVRIMPGGDPTKFPALFIFDQGDTQNRDEEETDTMAFVLSVGIDGFVAGNAPHSFANALYAAVIEALFPQPVLGGLATEIRIVRLDLAVAERAKDHRLGFSLELAIHYHTRFGEPRQPA